MNEKPKSFKGLAFSAIVIIAVLAGCTFYFQNIKGTFKKEIESLRSNYHSLERNASVTEETKRLRIDFFKRRHYLDFPLKFSYAAADFMRRLSLIVPGQIKLIDVELNPGNQSFTFFLNGRINSENNIKAKSKFQAFYLELEQFLDLIHLQAPGLIVMSDETKSGESPKGSPVKTRLEGKQTEFYFTINGEVEI